MKRVETININGIVFSIDDDAFCKLNAYLDTLSKYFEHEQGGREIIADIEARISELFAERNGGIRQAVSIEDVNKAVETLGTPEDIVGADAEVETENIPSLPPLPPLPRLSAKPSRRLYRDPDHRYIGGVCAGIAAWMGINPVIIRLIFILLLPFPRLILGPYMMAKLY